jgi:hypothetical protein
MNNKPIFLVFAILATLFLVPLSAIASEIESCQTYTPEAITCKSYTENELNLIKASSNPSLIMGAGIIDLVSNPSSTIGIGQELLNLGSRIESPKGMATVSLIVYQLNRNYNSSLKPLREKITQLLRDDKDNALSYYLNALLRGEEVESQEALALIKNGNTKSFNSYPKQRFDAIVQAGKIAKCKKIQAQQYALLNSLSTSVFIKTRHLCQKLIESNDTEAKNACLVMGQNLERSSITIVDKLNSLGIQKIALDNSPSNATALTEIKNKKDRALNCDGRKPTELIPEADVTEDMDLKYDKIYLESGECSALEFLFEAVKQKKQKN